MERVRSIFVQACGYAAAFALAAMMLLTVADVVLRSAFNYPIRGMLEIIELLLACSFFVALPASFLRDEHIVVDMIDPMAPEWVPALKRIGDMVTLVVISGIL
jgi:TRAP-type C4-dicarboxylate transport system permease small subunit